MDRLYYGNTILAWALALGLIVVTVIVARVAYWLFKGWLKLLVRRTSFKLDDIFIDLAEEPVVLLVVVYGARWSISLLALPEPAVNFSANVFTFLLAVCTTWFVVRAYDAIHRQYVAPLADETRTNLDDQLMPVVRTGVRATLWTLGVIIALDNVGYNVGTILAGLGIGGLAFALAAQDTVSNVFGGITILLQHPFQIEDVIILDERWLQVKQIGLRASRLEDFDTGHEVTIPNSKFTSSVITNVSRYPAHVKALKLHISAATSADRLTEALAAMEAAVESHAEARTIFIRVDQFEPSGIAVTFLYEIAEFGQRHRVTTEVNLEIMRALEKCGVKLALPLMQQVDQQTQLGVYG